jgi:acyl-coenzyme A synthetase/AMP-(fatty) acid ligase
MLLKNTDFIDLPIFAKGKVRDVYEVGDDMLLMIVTDRISAFDVVFEELIPDKGRILNKISEFWFVGRADDVIKSSGYRIGPFEVESALLEHPAVLECAITAVPDEIRGQIVKATVVLTKGYTPSDELIKTLQEHVKNVTAPYKYPRVIEFVDELPKTISGKIRRVEIRDKDIN